MQALKSKVRVGITIGDPSGIGPAITLKAVKKLAGLADFTVIGDNRVLKQSATPSSLDAVRARFVDLHNVSHKDFKLGEVRPEYGKASIEYLDKALELIRQGEIDCLVTAPISKEAINKAGFNYSGHTEYFSRKSGCKDPVMMLANNKLKFSLVTRHVPLKSVSSQLSEEKIYKTIVISLEALKKLFLIKKPRIVVCGLNPHASDNGIIGKEEDELINPAIKKVISKYKVAISGPISADVAVYKANKNEFDCVIAMYHDQALIPLKLCSPNTGVNLTLGLAFIRTSPLHGTAFDIAKKINLSNPGSMIQAIRLAVKCAINLKKD
ncbi:MAG: 4-hydroxythreonine-4-phosphate dehydrogenase PdxA [Omnitrophica WOR_2 bacterium RBG_13_44_8b]|nr:MAG: 4-hydroxythreonine-4-phosphate dehydrogenase PdxA [Omnitrophica WOR_2 bacterium RBG_13_44_8b]